jgi:hypothetical protein
MVPVSSRRSALLICCIVAGTVAVFLWPPGPLSLTTDGPKPASLTVEEFTQIDAGCRDDVSGYAMGRTGGGGYEQVSFIETGTPDPNLSARVERTSPPGSDVSTFRVYVDSHGEPRGNASCTLGAQYRLELDYDPATPKSKGQRVLYLENGIYAGCSSGSTGDVETECHRFTYDRQHADRTWANATAEG